MVVLEKRKFWLIFSTLIMSDFTFYALASCKLQLSSYIPSTNFANPKCNVFYTSSQITFISYVQCFMLCFTMCFNFFFTFHIVCHCTYKFYFFSFSFYIFICPTKIYTANNVILDILCVTICSVLV